MRSRRVLFAAMLAIVIVAGWIPLKPEPRYHGKSVSEWVHLCFQGKRWMDEDCGHVVARQFGARAVPFIVRELNSYCYPRWYYRALRWQARRPSKLWLLPEPKEAEGAISASTRLLEELGEDGVAAYPALARCIRGANTRLWEDFEVMSFLIQAGPVAREAVPTLRRFAADTSYRERVQAALAIYNATDRTNELVEALVQTIPLPDGFSHCDREIFWFRNDERVQSILLPLICPLVADNSRPESERAAIVYYLGDMVTTNILRRSTLESLQVTDEDSRLAKALGEALAKLANPDDESADVTPQPEER